MVSTAEHRSCDGELAGNKHYTGQMEKKALALQNQQLLIQN